MAIAKAFSVLQMVPLIHACTIPQQIDNTVLVGKHSILRAVPVLLRHQAYKLDTNLTAALYATTVYK